MDPQNELTPDLAARIARLESMLSPDGTVRCRRLVIMDAHGTARIVASVSPSGDALLEWLDSGQVRRIALTARADGTAAIVASDSHGQTRIAIGTNEDGESHLACVDAAGRPRITIGTSGGVPVPAAGGAGAGAGAAGGKAAEAPTSAAAISLIDEGGATRIALLSSKGDAVLNMSDAQRRVRIVSGTFADGSMAVPGMTG